MTSVWPQVVVALGLFAFMAAITIVAIIKYHDQPDQVMKIWNAQVGLLGAVIGMIASYFFTQATLSEAKEARELVHSVATEQRQVADQAVKENVRLRQSLGESEMQLRSLRRERGIVTPRMATPTTQSADLELTP